MTRRRVETIQINVGWRCDLACKHCHVEAGPNRSETMDRATADRILALLRASPSVATVDLTGGAPELNAQFRRLVIGARERGLAVIDRCNLTVLLEPGQEETAAFLADHQVKVIASLPCYTEQAVDAQRGRRVFERSIEALRRLARLGYGRPDSPLALDLVYNPAGASLPPPQAELEASYRRELRERFGIEFNHLLAITNMPIRRFARTLEREGSAEAYSALLIAHFNPETVPELMCRSMVSIGYDGRLYDCDFNQMLELPLGGAARSVWDISDFAQLARDAIATAEHCFGCTAGAGSSCGGSLL
ncbi:MAG TPA: arsenosugar biosynthesis radical SAM (seleno)protein ArsS [Myxococcota bacterium]|nr:arsenosugar biosynthesis radical SAM (seleno)protein ArsS [Myxococcota bacterium]